MSVGLLGLLDDVAAIAKVAAASLDDVAAQAAKAGAKAAAPKHGPIRQHERRIAVRRLRQRVPHRYKIPIGKAQDSRRGYGRAVALSTNSRSFPIGQPGRS